MTVGDGLFARPPVRKPAEVLISRTDLQTRVAQLGRALSDRFAQAPRPPVLVGVLKGSTMFLADLLRAMSIDSEVDFMSISSYEQSGVVRIVKDLERDVGNRDIVLVEDIVDTGLTLNYLRKTLMQRAPSSLSVVTLLDKLARRLVPVPLEYRGFEIPDVFVLGYGLDFQGRYRNVADILAVRDLARLANDPLLLVEGLYGGPGR
jgi:hypoxanthine phosphoribosyltransferase